MKVESIYQIFNQAISDYHIKDDVDAVMPIVYKEELEGQLYKKAWIDTVQWHLEDIIRDPEIVPSKALEIKRRIDSSNQKRTDLVELIDAHFVQENLAVEKKPDARLNTESLGWAIDRFSILCLKIYHMQIEADRTDASEEHMIKCRAKLNVLIHQMDDLTLSIKQLMEDIKAGIRYTKTYQQMKMYNDPSLNPILYSDKEK